MFILEFVSSAKRRKVLYCIFESVVFAFSTLFSLLVFLSLYAYLLPLAQPVRYIYWIVVVLVFLILLFRVIKKSFIREEKIIAELQQRFFTPTFTSPFTTTDSLISAWQLVQKISTLENFGMSEELAKKHIETLTEELRKISLKEYVNFKQLYKFLIPIVATTFVFAAFYFKSPEIINCNMLSFLYPSGRMEFETQVKVFPGSIKLPYGSELQISIITPITSASKPELFAKAKNSPYLNLKLNLDGNKYTTEKIQLISDIEYYVKWHGLKSQLYTIQVVEVPKLSDFNLKYFFPLYTNLTPKTGKIFGDTPLLLGTRIEFSALSNKQLKDAYIVTSYGRKNQLKINRNKISGELTVEQPGECFFELISEDGILDPSPAHYQINVARDLNPEIEILSPAQNLVVSEGSRIKIVYKATDDFGIPNIELKYKLSGVGRSGELEKTITIKKLTASSQKQELIDDYNFNISEVNVKPGDVITYFLKVTDNDTISGPKAGYSEVYNLEVFSYEIEHSKIEQELKDFRQHLLDLLGEQIFIKERLSDKLKEQRTITAEELQQLVKQQKDVQDHSQQITEQLKKVLDRMELDPYTNYQIFTEHKFIYNSIQALSKNQMTLAQNALAQKNFSDAQKYMEEIITNLERLSLLAEDVLQYQTMQDLLTDADKLNELAKDLHDTLAFTPRTTDPERIAKLNNTLDKINQLMEEVNKLLAKMPQELPEEFINQPAVKEINTQELQATANSLRDALNRRDFDSALRQAEQLLRQLQQMLKTLHDASKSVGFGGVDKSLQENLTKSIVELQQIVTEQNNLLDMTQQIEKIRQEEVIKEQEKLLDKLKNKQREAISKTHLVIDTNNRLNLVDFSPGVRAGLSGSLPLMEKVLKEFTVKVIVKSKEHLQEVITHLEGTQILINNYKVSFSTDDVGRAQEKNFNTVREEVK
ncbi:MAG: hypothetical protein QME68_04355, partial [Elusimicrobiota bacterium]|nr:hypothetical protein [Elusimicrobiota bacterium]